MERFIKDGFLYNTMKQKPQTLYRAYRISPTDLEERVFAQTIVPMNASAEYPKKTTDGNELGVYMSTNQTMTEQAYAISGKNSKIETKKYNSGRGLMNHLELPGLGIVLKIDTEGLEIREPEISEALKGHYNNGFEGKEWIADEVPSTNYHPIKFILSRYANDSKRFGLEFDGRNEDELRKAIGELKGHYEKEVLDYQEKAKQIDSLSEGQRRNHIKIGRILND